MSYDLGFWKYKNGVYHDNQEIYTQLNNEEYVSGIEEIPIEEILAYIANVFFAWERVGPTDFESENAGAFQIMLTKQFVRIDCYEMAESDMNKFIDVMFDYNCPLYDPQVPWRYDEHEG